MLHSIFVEALTDVVGSICEGEPIISSLAPKLDLLGSGEDDRLLRSIPKMSDTLYDDGVRIIFGTKLLFEVAVFLHRILLMAALAPSS